MTPHLRFKRTSDSRNATDLFLTPENKTTHLGFKRTPH